MRVRDAKGRTWTVRTRFSPWRRVVRVWSHMTGRNARRELSMPPRLPPPGPEKTAGDRVMEILLLPFACYEAIGPALVWLLVLPVTLAELAVLGVAGAGLAVARLTGLARYRVDVVAHTGFLLHSETTLLVRGRGRARELVAEVGRERAGAGRSFHPGELPGDVTVRTHRSVWQASTEWRSDSAPV